MMVIKVIGKVTNINLGTICTSHYGCEPYEYEVGRDDDGSQVIKIKHERPIGSEVLMSVSPDQMNVMATFLPAVNGGLIMSYDDALNNIFSTLGIPKSFKDEELFNQAYWSMYEGNLVDSAVVGHGKQPEHGADGRIQLFFEMPSDKPKTEDKDRADFKNLRRFVGVRKGQLLARLHPATDGTPGVTVNGTPIPAVPGKQVEILMGEGVARNAIGTEYYADVDGHVVFNKQNILTVFSTIEVKDVDFSTGNISFLGDVVVRGDVLAGFSVKAKNVVIRGVCHDNNISAEENIEIITGVKGISGSSNIISAGGDITVGYCESASLAAKGSITVNKYSFNCLLDAGDKVIAANKSTVAGGQIRSFSGCDLYNVGTRANTNINIIVGRKFDADDKFIRIREEKDRLQESYDKVSNVLTVLNLHDENVTKNPKVKKLMETKVLLERRIQLFERRIHSLMKDSICPNPTIIVRHDIQEGAVLNFFGTVYNVRRTLHGVKFVFDANNLVVDYTHL